MKAARVEHKNPVVTIKLQPVAGGYRLLLDVSTTRQGCRFVQRGKGDVRDLAHGLGVAEANIPGMWANLRAQAEKVAVNIPTVDPIPEDKPESPAFAEASADSKACG